METSRNDQTLWLRRAAIVLHRTLERGRFRTTFRLLFDKFDQFDLRDEWELDASALREICEAAGLEYVGGRPWWTLVNTVLQSLAVHAVPGTLREHLLLELFIADGDKGHQNWLGLVIRSILVGGLHVEDVDYVAFLLGKRETEKLASRLMAITDAGQVADELRIRGNALLAWANA